MKLSLLVSVVLLSQVLSLSAFKLKKNQLAAECGIENKVSSFIIGGDEAVPNRYPWMAALLNGGRFTCGSALISEEWAITAAHCVESGGSYSILLGSHNINSGSEPNRLEAKVSSYIMHEDYDFPHDDIAVLKLAEKVEFNDYIRPICLPNKKEQSNPLYGENVTAIGWGQADNGNGQSGLRQVGLYTLREDQQVQYCDDNYPSVLCIDTQRGTVGVCFGDSGSPLLHQRANGQYVTVGAASFVTDSSCQGSTPSGYSRVNANLDWISEKTGIEIDPGY